MSADNEGVALVQLYSPVCNTFSGDDQSTTPRSVRRRTTAAPNRARDYGCAALSTPIEEAGDGRATSNVQYSAAGDADGVGARNMVRLSRGSTYVRREAKGGVSRRGLKEV